MSVSSATSCSGPPPLQSADSAEGITEEVRPDANNTTADASFSPFEANETHDADTDRDATFHLTDATADYGTNNPDGGVDDAEPGRDASNAVEDASFGEDASSEDAGENTDAYDDPSGDGGISDGEVNDATAETCSTLGCPPAPPKACINGRDLQSFADGFCDPDDGQCHYQPSIESCDGYCDEATASCVSCPHGFDAVRQVCSGPPAPQQPNMLTWLSARGIISACLSSREITEYDSVYTSWVGGMDIDDDYLYWVDNGSNRLLRRRIDRSDAPVEVVFQDGMSRAFLNRMWSRDLEIDHGMAFWADQRTKRVYYRDLAATQAIKTVPAAAEPAITVAGDHIYLVASGRGFYRSILRFNYRTEQAPTRIGTMTHVNHLVAHQGYLYYRPSWPYAIYRIAEDGSTAPEKLVDVSIHDENLRVDTDGDGNTYLYWIHDSTSTGRGSLQVRRWNISGETPVETVWNLVHHSGYLTSDNLAVRGSHMFSSDLRYWTIISRSALDSRDMWQQQQTVPVSQPASVGKILYWLARTNDEDVLRRSLHSPGTSETLSTEPGTFDDHRSQLVSIDDRLFWLDPTGIRYLHTSDQSTGVFLDSAKAGTCFGALSRYRNYIVWNSVHKVFAIDSTNSAMTPFLVDDTGKNGYYCPNYGHTAIGNKYLAVEETSDDAWTKHVQTGERRALPSEPSGLVIVGDYAYWTERHSHRIRRIRLDGSEEAETVFEHLSYPRYLSAFYSDQCPNYP